MCSVVRGYCTSVAEVAREEWARIDNVLVRIAEVGAYMDHVPVCDRRERVQPHSRVLGARTDQRTPCAARDNRHSDILVESIGGIGPG